MSYILQRLYRTIASNNTSSKMILLIRNQLNQIVRYHIAEGFDESGTDLVLDELSSEIKLFVDVGANKGYWTDRIITKSPSISRGFLFEPSESAAKILNNRFGNDPRIEIIEAAVSNKRKDKAYFYEETDAGETSSLLSGHPNSRSVKKIVRQTSLDYEANKRSLDRIDFLKIDAEGYDLHVIKGASQFIKNSNIKFIQFEYNRPWIEASATLGAAIKFFESSDYSTYLIRSDGLYKLNYRRHGEYFSYSNFLAVSPDSQSKICPLIRGTL